MNKKYVVRLSETERAELIEAIERLTANSQKAKRAQILLQADENGPNWPDAQISAAYRCRIKTVENTRKQFVVNGLAECLNRKRRDTAPTPRLLDGRQEASIIALRLGSAPEGYAKWSLRLLTRTVVELGLVERISHETVRNTLKKTA